MRAPAFETAHASVYLGDVREVLAEMADDSVHCIVTSPPYWNLRDYSAAGQIGLEPTPAAYVAEIVAVFRELRRILRRDGTLWLNLGDSYANRVHGKSQTYGSSDGRLGRGPRPTPMCTAVGGLKVKDLVGMPWQVAFALREDGWYLRADVIWSKPNGMPESATDRPSLAHEHLFMFTRSGRYFYDRDAETQPLADSSIARMQQNNGQPKFDGARARREDAQAGIGNGDTLRADRLAPLSGVNLRSVWEIATTPFPDAHFATFPVEIPRRAIRLGTSEHGVCAECGSPWRRRIKVSGGTVGRSWHDHEGDMQVGNRAENAAKGGHGYRRETLGWRPSCDHITPVVPATVLDPFLGSGTTLEVAIMLGRRGVGVELAPDYLPMIEKRIAAGEMERSRVDGRAAGAPLTAVTVSDMGPLWTGVIPDPQRLKQDAVGKATYTGFNARWNARTSGRRDT
jgi:DNA modification methylase